MALKHISDEQIQEYLDRRVSLENEWISEHFKSCESCRKHLSQYEKLYALLKEDIDFSLSPHFSESVVAGLQKVSAGVFRIRVKYVMLSGIGLTLGVGTVLYFLGLKRLAGAGDQVRSVLQKSFNLEAFSTIINFLSNLHINLSLLGFALLIVLIMSAIDRFIIQSKRKFLPFI